MIDAGIEPHKIVVGKPSIQADAYGSGLVDFGYLGDWAKIAKEKMNWDAGIFTW